MRNWDYVAEMTLPSPNKENHICAVSCDHRSFLAQQKQKLGSSQSLCPRMAKMVGRINSGISIGTIGHGGGEKRKKEARESEQNGGGKASPGKITVTRLSDSEI